MDNLFSKILRAESVSNFASYGTGKTGTGSKSIFCGNPFVAVLLIFFIITASAPTGWAQQSLGPLFPTAGSNNTGVGAFPWINPTNIYSNNNLFASSNLGMLGVSNYLQATGFGFSIPEDATISGIQVTVGRYSQNGDVRDFSVRLLKEGSVAGSDKATGTYWPGTEVPAVYGGASDLWEVSWTPADINSGSFGTRVSGQNGSFSARVAYVDYITITVTYICPVPAQPGSISGSTFVCPGTTGLSYSISSVPNTTSYLWGVPSGWEIISGQGSTNITVDAGTEGGLISVAGVNSCGTGTAMTLEVAVYPAFSPGAINTTGQNICSASGDPDPIGSQTPATGGDNYITYKWQYSTDEAWTSPQDIPESNSETYDPPAGLTESRWYRRQAHDGTCNTDFMTSSGIWKVAFYPEFSPGSIPLTGQTICASSNDPSPIGSITPASGGDGVYTYQWQYSIDESWTSPQVIPESNSETYDPPAGLTESRWYRRQAHDGTCSTEYVNSSGVWQVNISNEWTGEQDNDWNNTSNWSCNELPNSTSDVTITSAAINQPVILSFPLAECNNLYLEPGSSLIIAPGVGLTVNGAFFNSGTLYLWSATNGLASLIAGDYTRETGGTENINLYLRGGGWHYISTPVSSFPSSGIGSENLAAYYENRISSNQDLGWIAYDGYRYADGSISDTTFSELSPGTGYDYYHQDTRYITFSGSLNTKGVNVNLAYNSKGTIPDYPESQGFNLVGNPFTSCLDWDQIASTLDPVVSSAIYFTYNGIFASYVNGVGTNGGTATIPPMQGFFTKTNAPASLFLNEGARVHNPIQLTYKGDPEKIPLIRLKIDNELKSDETVIRFDEKATYSVDNNFDAYKFSQTGNGIGIWTITENVSFSINALPFPNSNIEIPVGIYNSDAELTKITCTELEDLDDYTIILTDKQSNVSVDLKESNSYTFLSNTGTVSDRFEITISNISTGLPEIPVNDIQFNIYSGMGMIYIKLLDDKWDMQSGSVIVYDLSGRMIYQTNNNTWSTHEIKEIPLNAPAGIYFVEIKSKNLKFVGKLNFNK